MDGVKLLQDVLGDKFKLDCTLNIRGSGHRIRIHKKSLPAVPEGTGFFALMICIFDAIISGENQIVKRCNATHDAA